MPLVGLPNLFFKCFFFLGFKGGGGVCFSPSEGGQRQIDLVSYAFFSFYSET